MSPRLRIVHVITRFVNGGADENTLLTCNHQAEAGHDVWLAYGRDWTERMRGQLDPRVRAVAIPSLVREISPAKDVAALCALARLYRRVRPDIVHTHTSKAGIVGRLAALAWLPAKVVHGVHILPFTSEPFLKRIVYVLLEKLAALRTHAFIDVSEGMRDLCLENGLGTDDNHFVIPSGMDVERFRDAPPAEDIEALRRSIKGALILVYVAVLERRKRHLELLQALLPLMRRDGRILLVMAGDGPDRATLEAFVEAEGVGGQVRFLGFRGDVEQIVAGCDIGVFASQREGLPRSVVQYVLAGKPVVAAALPGIDRVVRDGGNGFVVPGETLDALVEKIAYLADEPGLLARFAAASREMDLSAWNAQAMTDRIAAVYGRISDV